MPDTEIPILLIGIAIGFGLGVLATEITWCISRGLHWRRNRRIFELNQLFVELRHQALARESPASESESWTRRTWPGARKSDEDDEL